MQDFITIVGLDAHKESIEIVTADEFGQREVRHVGKVGGGMMSLDKAVRKLRSRGSELRFVYEAGPCGYEIYRHLSAQGYHCAVVAASMIPRKSGNRIKNDRWDAEALARLYRAGELTAVYVPCEEDEAMRDLTRGRQDAVKGLRTARQQLGVFLLRHGLRYTGKTSWTASHMRWLSDIKMPHPAQQITLQEYSHAVRERSDRVERLSGEILMLLSHWRMEPVVKAFQSLRGVAPIVAATMVAEIGDLSRFKNPRQLMAYVGLVPSEHSSGGTVSRGGITKTGNGHARRVLIEAAQTYSYPARVSRHLRKRQDGVSQLSGRLHGRHRCAFADVSGGSWPGESTEIRWLLLLPVNFRPLCGPLRDRCSSQTHSASAVNKKIIRKEERTREQDNTSRASMGTRPRFGRTLVESKE